MSTTAPAPARTPANAASAIDRLARTTALADRPRRRLVTSLIAFTVAMGVAVGGLAAAHDTAEAEAAILDTLGAADLTTPASAYELVLVPRLAEQLTLLERATTDVTRGGEPGQRDPATMPVSVLDSSLAARLPEGAGVLVWDQSWDLEYVSDVPFVTNMDITDPLAAGSYDTAHAAPLVGDQALASERWLALRDASVGDRLSFGAIGEVEIVGTVERVRARGQAVLVLAPGRPVGEDATGFVRVDLPGTTGTPDDLVSLGLDQDSLYGPGGDVGDGFTMSDGSLDELRVIVDGQTFDGVGMHEPESEVAAAIDATDELLRDDPEAQAVYAEHRAAEVEEYGHAPGPLLGQGTVIEAHRAVVHRQTYGRSSMVEQTSDAPIISGVTATATSVLLATMTGFVAAAAFVVGLRRRLREVGMLGAVGATPAQVDRLLRREGRVLGLRGASIGLVVGVGLLLIGAPVLSWLVGFDISPGVPVFAVVAPPVAGLIAAAVAASGPARLGASIPVVTALAGRVPSPGLDLRVPRRGALAALAGVALIVISRASGSLLVSLALPLGLVLVLLGATGLAGALVAGGGVLAGRLPLVPRLALRDAARQRTRSTAAVGAVAVLLMLPVLAAVGLIAEERSFTTADEESYGRDLVYSPFLDVSRDTGPFRSVAPSDAGLALVAEHLPTTGRSAEVLPLRVSASWGPIVQDPEFGLYVDGGAHADAVLGTPELLEVLGLASNAIPDGGALLLTGSWYASPPAEGDALGLNTWAGGEHIVPFTSVDGIGLPAPELLVDPELVTQLGIEIDDDRSVLVELDRRVRQTEVNRLSRATEAYGGSSFVSYEWGGVADERLAAALAIAAAVLGVALVTAIALGMTAALAASESDRELVTLLALGGSPNLRRRVHGWLAWWHATLGGVLALGAGGAITLALAGGWVDGLAARDVGLVAAVCAAVLLVVPPLVGLTVGLAMRRTPKVAPRRRS